jgi:hypothetical protein
MPYVPDVHVTIDGNDLSGITLETVRVVRGRDDVYDEPRAGYAICELIDLTGTGLGIEPLQTLSITIDDSLGAPVDVFTGIVSDTAIQLYDAGEVDGTPKGLVTVIATAPLARLNRRVVLTGGRAEELDGDRIAALITEALAATWEETGGTWADVATATTTWDTFDPGLDLDLIDQPGIYDIAALPAAAEGYAALAQATLTAQSARGIVFDTADGFVAYADGNSRAAAVAADGYIEIDAGILIAGILNPTSTQSDITNRVFVEFEGGSVEYTDTASLLDYGLLANQFETNLADAGNAEAWALDYLEDHARPVSKLRQVAIRLDGVDDPTIDILLAIDVNSPVNLIGLPATLGLSNNFAAFVEGLQYDLNRETVQLSLTISAAALSFGSEQWQQVPESITWDDVLATLRWEQASEVAA